MTVLDEVTWQLVREALTLTPEDIARAYDHGLTLWLEGGREASAAVRVSAAQNSEIDSAVGAGFRARADELNAHRQYLLSDAIDVTGMAARAVQVRAKLTDAHYRILLEPLSIVGLAVPPRV